MESFASLFEEQVSHLEMREGEVVNAEVVSIDNKYVTVNAGLKSESIIPLSEFKDEHGELEVKIGDKVKVAIEAVEDGYGETRLSRDKARRMAAWTELEEALENGDILSGAIYGRVKGGLGVMYKNVRLFLPGSLLDIRTVRDFSPYEGTDVEFKVIKVDRRRNNIVVSRKAVLAEKSGGDTKELLEKMQEGSVVSGVVKNITDYGAFVDLGGIDGLLYITDLSWKRVKHPSDVLSIGQEVEAVVLRFDREKHRVSLGLKQLSNDPWVGIEDRYPIGTRMFGKVSNITDYGAFVELDTGIEGLVHVSEMDWTNKSVHPSKIVKVGDEVQVQVLELDSDKRRISLGIKQCKANPWIDFADKFKNGDKVAGQIRSITDFGLFIGLDGGIDGLVHVSDISWDNGEAALRDYKKGQDVEAVIISIDVEKERVALGIKQLDSDPFAMFINNYDKGSLVKGEVKAVEASVATITLTNDIDAILPVSEVSNDEAITDLTEKLKVGDSVEAVISSIDKKAKTITLSIKAKDAKIAAEAVKKAKIAAEKSSGTTSLGALLQDKFQSE